MPSSSSADQTCHASASTSTSNSCDATIPTTTLKNTALVFIKPHANTPKVHDLVVDKLTQVGIEILSQVDISGKEMEERKLIDNHYYSIASKATLLDPNDINVPTQRFMEIFGEEWKTVLEEHRAFNALQACEQFQLSPSQLNEIWTDASSSSSSSSSLSSVTKFGGGFYCAKLDSSLLPPPRGGSLSQQQQPQKPVYVFNGFFMSMRSKFVGPDKEIRCYVVQWDPTESSSISWKQFRGEILGPTDPSIAPIGSIRRTIYDSWQTLGLESIPTNADNGVHASASPLEGLAERINFLGLQLQDDDFAKYLLEEGGISQSTILSWTKDPQIILSSSDDKTTTTYGSIFDELEDLDVSDCARRMMELNRYNSVASSCDTATTTS